MRRDTHGLSLPTLLLLLLLPPPPPPAAAATAAAAAAAEPGYYEDGAFGIRIENVLLAKEVETPSRFGGRPFLVGTAPSADAFLHVPSADYAALLSYCRDSSR